jgi:hypothetical protein
MGLGRPFVMEVSPDVSIQNSIIVRDNARFIGNDNQVDGKQWY